MKQPFWILNSILLLLFIIILWFVFFSKVKVPPRKNISPDIFVPAEKPITQIDSSAIYNNDLFNTYRPIVKEPSKLEPISAIPIPPEPIPVQIPPVLTPQFFDALPLTLTGVIMLNDETKNKAIIMDNRTNKQTNYKVGDEIEDAQIIRIFKNKVILIRSNGQQEILYLTHQDAKFDSNILKTRTTKPIVKKINDENYIIDPDGFAMQVRSLGEFIDMLDLQTAYKQGKSIGSKVGKIESDSIVSELGLNQGDIITKINGKPVDTTENRLEIYNKISLNKDKVVNLDLLRHNSPFKINYQIRKIKKFEKQINQTIHRDVSKPMSDFERSEKDTAEAEKIRLLKEKYDFAPTMQEIKLREKCNMAKKIDQSKINNNLSDDVDENEEDEKSLDNKEKNNNSKADLDICNLDLSKSKNSTKEAKKL